MNPDEAIPSCDPAQCEAGQINKYPEPVPSPYEAKLLCRDRHDSLTQRLCDRKARLEEDLKSVNDALNNMRKHPEISKVIDSITEVFGNNLR